MSHFCKVIVSIYVWFWGGVVQHLSHGKNLFLIFSQWSFCFIANGSISLNMICWIGFLLSPCPVSLGTPCRRSAPLATTGIYTTPQKAMLLSSWTTMRKGSSCKQLSWEQAEEFCSSTGGRPSSQRFYMIVQELVSLTMRQPES